MSRIILAAAALSFGLSAASACDFHKTAHTAKADSTVVASVASEAPMSEPVIAPEDSKSEKPAATITE